MTILTEGTLRAAMEKNLKVAVVVIDEDGSEDTQEAQKEVLFWARMYGHPIAFIEYDKTVGGYPSIKTDPELKKMAPADAPVFTKYQSNGFVDTDFEAWLKKNAPQHVVVMGMETNCCVEALVIGGWTVSTKTTKAINDPGLVGRGYSVLSVNAVMRSEAPRWGGHPKVKIYPKIDEDV